MEATIFFVVVIIGLACIVFGGKCWRACLQMGACTHRDWAETFGLLAVGVTLLVTAINYLW
jgi:hypothetical protein